MRIKMEKHPWNSRVSWWIAGSCAGLVILAALADPVLARGKPNYAADISAFFKEMDRNYPFFELKGIRKDWEQAKRKLWSDARRCRTDSAFLGLIVEAMQCLRDGHMWFREKKAEVPATPPRYYPGISFLPTTEGRVVVMHPPSGFESVLPSGAVVVKIDGKKAREVLEERARAAWKKGGHFSSPQRARLYEYRIPLRGARGEKHVITVFRKGRPKNVKLTSTQEAKGWPHTYNLPDGLTRVGRSFYHTKRPEGAGYIYVRRMDGSTVSGFEQALEAHPDARGWIVDLRGNGGGGYGTALIEKMKTLPRPVAVLIDAGCVSAGETFARDLRKYAEARLFGDKTAGASSAKSTWAFPSGIASISRATRSRWRNDGKPIEFNGIEPDETVEAVPEEIQEGRNSALCRAEAYLASLLKK